MGPLTPNPCLARELTAVTPFCSEVGAGLTALGVLFLLLGVLFLFDGPLLAMGDVRLGQGAQAPELRSLHTKTPAPHS